MLLVKVINLYRGVINDPRCKLQIEKQLEITSYIEFLNKFVFKGEDCNVNTK
jgi:hypothetical protein